MTRRERTGVASGASGVALVAWLAGVAAVLAGAVAAGAAPGLAAPSPADLSSPGAWLDAREPVVAAFALVRVAVVASAAWLLASTLLAVAVRLVGAPRLVGLADLVTVPAVRRVVSGALGVGLLGATVVPAAGGAWAATTSTAVEQPTSGGDAAVDDPPAAAPAPPTMHRLDHPAPPAAAPATVTLRPGDHLWSVAEQALAGAWGRPPTTAELAPYWAALVEVNRPSLPDPGNPDLVFPGDTVVVPPAPPAP